MDDVFLLSPAYCGGRRATMLLRAGSTSTLAGRLADGALTLGDAFAFLSGLYFRGKLAYATTFTGATSATGVGPMRNDGFLEPAGCSLLCSGTTAATGTRTGDGRGESGIENVLVITPTRGLLSPLTNVSRDMLQEFASVDLHEDNPRYRTPLVRDARSLAARLSSGTRVILLGSIASDKYVSILSGVFGARLHHPVAFVGRGDMSRGGLLLRSARERVPLEYAVLDPAGQRRGARPPKLAPLARVNPV